MRSGRVLNWVLPAWDKSVGFHHGSWWKEKSTIQHRDRNWKRNITKTGQELFYRYLSQGRKKQQLGNRMKNRGAQSLKETEERNK